MQLNQAITVVQQQFVAEAQDQVSDELRRVYDQACERYPAMMRVAHHIWADELIRQNLLQAQRQAQAQQSQQQQQ